MQRVESEPIPTLVLLGALLPLAGGEDVLRADRATEMWSRVPIYIVTADLRLLQRPASLAPDAPQANGVIEKGVEAIHKLRELFEKYREKTTG